MKPRTEITPDEIRRAFKIPKDTRIAVSVNSHMPTVVFDRLVVGKTACAPVKTDPTFLVG